MSNYSQRLLMNSTIHIAQRRTFSLQRAHNYVLLLYGAKKNVKSLHYHRFKQFIGTVGKTTVQCTCHRYPPQQRMYASMHTGSMSKNRGGKAMSCHRLNGDGVLKMVVRRQSLQLLIQLLRSC